MPIFKELETKIHSTILGGIAGDALGVPNEFQPRGQHITGMTGYGTHNQPPGTWSDDTSLILCLIENLIEEKDEYDLMGKFMEYRKGYWTPYGTMFDIGHATDNAIERYVNGIPLQECGGKTESDNGNGALMRIAPLVFTLRQENDFHVRGKEIERVAGITHSHPRSTLGCIIYIQLLLELYNGHPPLHAFRRAADTCLEELRGLTQYEREFSHYERIFNKSILDADISEIKSTGYVVHSLEAAIWCFLTHESYRDAVLKAVNLGNDTDTIGLLTGTLAGMAYGMDSIPTDWLETLARKAEIEELCAGFAEFCYSQF
ncbi:ADP-ribosylglycohydrolase family protein [Metabacillus sp. GX 13764]|uniref:ADP-ribosylglycohydrolase family protein n=1 Tax=Metabacillus kandeliae TaxID=2900151 RepID=UPI001E4C48ED|nr:ADP-ribosylglycohydrolase family protein [Metabacillus kandeliae]MCD7034525.1 ADP-ribosylglycohydrolase family protein [Metabacillus kandeliae]